MQVPAGWSRVDADALRSAAATLRERPSSVARYFPDGPGNGLAVGMLRYEEFARPGAAQQMAELADSLDVAAASIRQAPGLGAIADSVAGTASALRSGSPRLAESNLATQDAVAIHEGLRQLRTTSASLDAIAALGRVPDTAESTRTRMLELTAGPFGRLTDQEARELSVLAHDLPDTLRATPARPRWERPLAEHVDMTGDAELDGLHAAIRASRQAELGGLLRYPTSGAASARIRELMDGDLRRLSVQDALELSALGWRSTDDVDALRGLPTYVRDGIASSSQLLDHPATPAERRTLEFALGHAAMLQQSPTRRAALENAAAALDVPRADLDPVAAGRIAGLEDLPARLRPVADPLFTPHEMTFQLVRAQADVAPLYLKANTDQAWADLTLDSTLLGMRSEVQLALEGRTRVAAGTAPTRLADVARREMTPVDVLEAQLLATRRGDGVLDAAAPTATGRVSLGARLATAELLHFGNELRRLPIVRTYLAHARAALDDVGRTSASTAEYHAVDQLRALLDRNIARIDGLEGATDGYLQHPDAADIGRISQLAQLLDRIASLRTPSSAATETLTW